MKRFFLVFAYAAYAAAFISLNFNISLTVLFLLAGVLLVIGITLYLKFSKAPYSVLAITLALSFIVMLGYSNIYTKLVEEPTKKYINKELVINAIVVEEPSVYEDYSSMIIKSNDNKKVADGTRFLVYYKNININYNDIIKVKLTPQEQTYTSYYSDKVFLKGTASEINIVKRGDSTLYSKAINLRNYIKSVFLGKINDDVAGIPIGMLTGNRKYISDSFNQNVKRVGMTHVMAVSGLHISIICLSIVSFLRKTAKLGIWIPSIIGILVVIIMAAIAGFSGSILRAGIMYLVVFIGNLFSKRSDPLNSLGFAVTLLLLYNPYNIYSVSLILSALGTIGILLFSKSLSDMLNKLYPYDDFLRKPYEYLTNGISVTLTANLFIIPVSILTFGYVSTISPIVNLILSPIVYFSLLFSLLAVIFSFVPILNTILLFIVEILAKCFKFVVDYFAEFNFNCFYSDDIMLYIFIFLILAALIAIFVCGQSNVTTLILASVICIFLPISAIFQGYLNSNKINYFFPSTNSGTAMVIESNEHFVLVVSTTENNALKQIKYKLDDRLSPKIDLLIMPSENKNIYKNTIKYFKEYGINNYLLCDNSYYPDAKSLNNCKVNIWDAIKLTSSKSANGYNLYFNCGTNNIIIDNYGASANKNDYLLTENLSLSYKINKNSPNYIITGESAKNRFNCIALNNLGAKAIIIDKHNNIFARQKINKELNFFQ